MVIYLDVLIVVNAYITYFTLKATARLLHLGYKTGRLIAASLIGGISAAAAAVPMGFLPSVLLRAVITAGLTTLAFGFSGVKPLLMRIFINVAGSALICGGAILLKELTGSSVFGAAGGYPYFNISVLTLIAATTGVYIALTLFRRICDKPDEGSLIKITVKKNGKTAEISAFPDSGNNLRDFLTGLPVIVCRKEKYEELFPLRAAEDGAPLPSGTRLIPFSSVGGSGIITAFKPDLLTAETKNGKKHIEALIGTGDEALKAEEFDAVINPKILI